jgi:hypothetical protein
MTKELWISRDSKKYGNYLYLYTCEPEKGCVDLDGEGYFLSSEDFESTQLILPEDWFPEITWENSPQKIKINL